jgi:diguanylate cyclase (GGDEF)-like protein
LTVLAKTLPQVPSHWQLGGEVQVVNDFDNPTTLGPRQPYAGRSPLAGAPPARHNEHASVPCWPRPGLPAPRVASRGARNAQDGPAEAPDDVDNALEGLPSLLARSATGIEFIYKTLELIAARYRLRDLVVVTPAPDKPQIFRLGRASLAAERGPLPPHLGAALTGREGLYADPPVVGPVAAACVTSLVELALRQDLLVHDASHDALTGLLNRRSYELLLAQAVSRARRYGWPFALVLLDLDNFKVVNDHYGHAAGDTALKAVGAELRASLRAGDVAARLGGDEFALLVVGVDNVAALSPLLGRLKKALERSVPETNVSFSVGLACFPSDTDDPDALTELADARLYAAKAAMEYR